MQSTKSRFSSIKIALWVVVLFQLSDVSAQQCYDAAVPMCGAYGNPLSFEQYQNSCVDEKNAYYEITCKKAKYEKQPDGMWYCMIPYHKRTNMGSYWSDDDLERGTLATCPPNGNYVLNQTNGHCERVPSCPSPTDLPQQCNRKDLQDGKITLHPIIPINGEKFRQEIDISLPSPHAIIFERNYRSGRVGASSFGKLNSTSVSFSSTTTDSSGNSSTTVVPGDTEIDFATGISYPEELVNGSIYQNRALSSLGQGWSTNLISRLSITQSTYQGILPQTIRWAGCPSIWEVETIAASSLTPPDGLLWANHWENSGVKALMVLKALIRDITSKTKTARMCTSMHFLHQIQSIPVVRTLPI